MSLGYTCHCQSTWISMLVVVSLGDTCRCQFAWMSMLGLVSLACPAIDHTSISCLRIRSARPPNALHEALGGKTF